MEIKDLNSELELKAESEVARETEAPIPRQKDASEEDVLAKRGACSKTFLKKKGTYETKYYQTPVHIYDSETGSFIDVNDKVVEAEDKESYQNEQHDFKIRFFKGNDENALFSVCKEEQSITASARSRFGESTKKLTPTLAAKDTELDYSEVMADTDYRCTVVPCGVKTEILIRKAVSNGRFGFRFAFDGLQCKSAANALQFVSDDESPVFTLAAPYMIDAAGRYTERVSLVPFEANDGEIDVDIVPEAGWLNEADREYPVRVEWVLREDVTDAPHIAFENSSVEADGKLEVGASAVPFRMVLPKRNQGMLRKKVELLLQCENAPAEEDREFFLVLDRVTVDPETEETETKRIAVAPLAALQTEYALNVTSEASVAKSASYALRLCEVTDGGLNPVSDSSVAQLNVSPISGAPRFSVTETDGTSEEDKPSGGETGNLGTVATYEVDVVTGLLNMEMKDFIWEGNRMPVSISHSFRGQHANGSYLWKDGVANPFANMQIGLGWRLNLMQCMIHTGTCEDYRQSYFRKDTYTYIDESENETVFAQCECESGTCTKYEDVNGLGYVYDAATGIMNKGSEQLRFTDGRLTKITDEYGNSMDIVYASGKISCVRDGVNRTFTFSYDGSKLISIIAPNGAIVSFSYCNNRLCCASFPNGQTLSFVYHADSGLPTSVTVGGASVSSITTAFTLGQNGTQVEGISNGSNRSVEFNYVCHGKETIITEIEAADGDECPAIICHRVLLHEQSSKNYTYYECGDESKIEVTGTHGIVVPYTEPGMEIGNLKCQNLLPDHNFTSDIANVYKPNYHGAWRTNMSYPCVQYDPPEKMPGLCSALLINKYATDVDKGIWQNVTLQRGQDYVFSCYLKLWRKSTSDPNHGVYLMVRSGDCVFTSQKITTRGEFQRVALRFHVDSSCGTTCQVGIYITGKVYARAIAPQLEMGTYLSPFNYLTTRSTSFIVFGEGVNCPNSQTFATVDVPTGKDVKETFTLSGYVRGAMDADSEACLTAKINYTHAANEETSEEHSVPVYSVSDDPTFAMIQFSKKQYRTIESITIVCENNNNTHSLYFTDLQLVRNCYEDGLSEMDFDGVASTGSNDDPEVDDRTTDAPTDVENIVFEEVKDAFGNVLTSTNFQNGEFGTIYGESKYEETVEETPNGTIIHYHDDGNNQTQMIDARGNTTQYEYDPVTSKPKKVADRCYNETEYTYDNTGRTIGVKAANGGTVGYSYNGYDDVTAITRGDGQAYQMQYDPSRNLTAVGLKEDEEHTQNLVSYAYKAGTNRLKSVTYANGSVQTLTYDRFGNVIKEVWERSENNEHIKEAEYRYSYDASQNLIKTIDILNEKMYNIIRCGDKIASVEEYDIVWDATDGATDPVLVGTMVYSFDGEGNQFRKQYVPADGSQEQKYVYEFKDEQNVAVQLPTGAVSHAKADHFGRKVFDELQLGKGFLNRTFTYHDGTVSQKHQAENKRVSSPTTILVKEIKFADGRTIQYEFDKEDRITRVVDSLDGTPETTETTETTVYTYDALGQLLTETKNGEPVNAMTYDLYGNMTTKNGAVFTYDSNGVWKDLLMRIESQSDPYLNGEIVYDANGNPTTYLGHALTWEKGRQLKQFDDITYKYNNEGIRIEKVENCKIHKYVLEGSTILKEIVTDACCNGNGYTNEYLYDLDGTVCGIKHNDSAFYFYKNLQDDVIAITDETGAVVAKYSYDAWGKCTIVEDTSDCNIATLNPFRYRGYYYDSEIGMYYLQSRYYDPEIGRFINADCFIHTTSESNSLQVNKFVYATNSPAVYQDDFGTFTKIGDIILGAICGIAVEYVGNIFNNIFYCLSNKQPLTAKILNPFMTGTVLGQILAFVNAGVKGAIDFVFNFGIKLEIAKVIGESILSQVLSILNKETKKFSWSTLIKDVIWGLITLVIEKKVMKASIITKNKKEGKAFNREIRAMTGKKGSNFYKKAWEDICKKAKKKTFFIMNPGSIIKKIVDGVLTLLDAMLPDCLGSYLDQL